MKNWKNIQISIIFILTLLSVNAWSGVIDLTAEVYIEDPQVNGNEFSWKIYFKPVSGWTGGALGGNAYLNSASWYFNFNHTALTNPVITDTGALLDGFYNSTPGITGETKVFVSTTPLETPNPQTVTEGTKYYLYTVKMTITNSTVNSLLLWNRLDTGIENVGGLVATGDADTGGEITFNDDGGDMALPINLSSYRFDIKNNSILLKWTTETETNCYGYNIYKSEQEIGPYSIINTKIIPGAGTSTQKNHYEFIDSNINKSQTYYYKIDQVDINGKHSYYGPLAASFSEKIPTEYSLEQNFPNPFNPGTTIYYNLPKQSLVTINVYNLKGELVQVLFNGSKEAGSYSLDWNATLLPSGTYFIKLSANDFSDIKKCLLIK
ncbi:T9SS type A sorting domain-containing protein [candidate division KSB1 bacterium]|nr:T9SS type A sorting domain-containing protein [candidate division KSB1 bacterium]